MNLVGILRLYLDLGLGRPVKQNGFIFVEPFVSLGLQSFVSCEVGTKKLRYENVSKYWTPNTVDGRNFKQPPGM